MRYNYSFVDTLRGGISDGVYITWQLSDEEIEAEVDRMIDPELGMIPRKGDDTSAYPDACMTNPELRAKWEDYVIQRGLPLSPLYLLPEGSRLRDEWFRRSEILKEQRAKMRGLGETEAKEKGA